jgi:hypothetical protein
MTIGLAMLVKDEAASVEACIASALPVIDAWTVIDTGSTDDTPELVERALDGVPGQLLRRPWRDFGHNRTELLQEARGSADYLLTLDADHILHQHAPIPDLDADEYLIRQDGRFDCALPLLLRASRDWEYRGRAHSYLAVADSDPVTSVELPALTIEAREEGRDRRGKYERDAKLLAAAVAEDPDDARSVFYLAQTYRDLDRPRDAAEMYKRRVEMGGWEQETFWAAYQYALCTGDDRDMLAAYELRPSRAESLYVLAKTARLAGRPAAGLLYAEAAAALPYPDDLLFIIRWIYEWGAELEACHCLVALGRVGDAIPRLCKLGVLADPAGLYARNTLTALATTR